MDRAGLPEVGPPALLAHLLSFLILGCITCVQAHRSAGLLEVEVGGQPPVLSLFT